MTIATILNRCHRMLGFVYGKSQIVGDNIYVEMRARKGSKPICSGCEKPGPTYDTLVSRRFEFVPLWAYAVFLWYRMRRVDCKTCGITVEKVPWADGKHRTCNGYRLFLARWARRLPWSQVAQIFGTNWGVVYRSVKWVVAYGLAHRVLDGIKAVGIDEIAVWTGEKYLTVVYQVDKGARRLLWVGRDRTKATLRQFFKSFGKERTRALQFVVSDMWKPFLEVLHEQAGQAVHILDRFHIVAKLHKAVDEVRAKEARELAKQGFQPILKHSRWSLLKRREKQTPAQRQKLADVLRYDLKTARAYRHKESFDAFWSYTSPLWAGWFLDPWCKRVMRSRLEPLKRFARTIRAHRPLLVNWYAAKGEVALGAVEGFNTNAKLAIRKARGYRSYEVLETALYHELGRLPEPEFTHRFC
jgi:transposase